MTLNIVMQYYADLSFNANFRESFRRFWRWMPDRVGHDVERWPVESCSICRNDAGSGIVPAFLLYICLINGEISMRIKNILLIITAITIVSCNDARKSETFRVLEDVDSYIEARPDSALAVLEGIDKSELTSKELEAKYALLLSQALDKNYIDLQSDSIIAPAVRYYENHGTPDERLKMYYYSGRIKQNNSTLIYNDLRSKISRSFFVLLNFWRVTLW